MREIRAECEYCDYVAMEIAVDIEHIAMARERASARLHGHKSLDHEGE